MSETSSGGVEVLERESESGADGGGPGIPPTTQEFPSASPSGVPFVGWNALAEVIEDVNPGIACLMYGSALLMQSAIEQTFPALLDGAREWMSASGVPDSFSSHLESALFEELLPISVDEIAAQILATYEEMSERERSLLNLDSASPLGDAVVASYLEVQPDLIDQHERAQELVAGAPEHSHPRWWTTCSLEMPNLLGPGQESIYCSRPRRRADRVSVTERTYLGRLYNSLKQPEVRRGFVDRRFLRPDIDQPRVDGFWDNVGLVNSYGFSLHFDVGHGRKFFDNVANTLTANKPIIDGVIQSALGVAAAAATTALASVTGPVSFVAVPGINIAATFLTALLERLQKRLIQAFSDSELTTWVIYQTVILDNSGVPLTTFVLAGPNGEVPVIQQAVNLGRDSIRVSDRYVRDPGFHQHARFMIGQTVRPSNSFDDRLWEISATLSPAAPISWTDATYDQGGCRVILPHTCTQNDARYASAVRAETVFDVNAPLGWGPAVQQAAHH